MEARLHRILSFSSLYLRHWLDRSTLKKLKVARTPENSAHPWCICLGHQSLPPTNLSRLDEEMVPPGQAINRISKLIHRSPNFHTALLEDLRPQLSLQNNNPHHLSHRQADLGVACPLQSLRLRVRFRLESIDILDAKIVGLWQRQSRRHDPDQRIMSSSPGATVDAPYEGFMHVNCFEA
ncbi:hypothetical protein TNCV_2187981 [Trichonephila clavipes]|nr:hypothetical protein TNCV_2187981 [Trichonephila clavipes]